MGFPWPVCAVPGLGVLVPDVPSEKQKRSDAAYNESVIRCMWEYASERGRRTFFAAREQPQEHVDDGTKPASLDSEPQERLLLVCLFA